ncbi:MAG: hypothetical protein U9P49_09800, partial [Thermodesulfobacteriota bacterium]|nr:hypothetical protein [Thermodesulfobacteriota bacterium]
MRKTILGMMILGSVLLFTGCVKPIEVKKYTPPKTKSASSSVNGIPLRIKYDLSGDSTTLRWVYNHIYNANTNELLATAWLPGKKDIKNVFKTTQNIHIMGTIGDKVVFVWKNGGGTADVFLSVYDFSEDKTYHLLGNDEKFTILQKGNSYVLAANNKAISLNTLKEIVGGDARGYKTLSLSYFSDGVNDRINHKNRRTVLTPDKAYFYIGSAANATGRLDNLMFGQYRVLQKAYM